METPDQLLSRLEVMGEERVKALVGNQYFKPKAIPLVQGWLARKEEARERLLPENVEAQNAVDQATRLAREAQAAAGKAGEAAALALESSNKADRLARIAIVVGAAGMLVSVLALFALSLR